MSDIAIKVENLSKMYKLGSVSTGTLGDDLTRWWARVRGKEDPFAKVAVNNDRSQKATSDYVWSLKDIDFEIKKGDAVGVIGRNGAGKSTLLKILSRVTTPTTGNVRVNGRVASLLEVGTGFHGDLSGRENIYMNGAILGMTRREISTKIDEIIDFSGVAGYIDTPVKRYSSGMYVRLAFSVAAHLEPEILIVDEVLAVGDAEFQKKCLGKLQDVNSEEGRTVLFVSHNITAMKKLCTKGIFLQNGLLRQRGSFDDTLHTYLVDNQNERKDVNWEESEAPGNEYVKLISAKVIQPNPAILSITDDFSLAFVVRCTKALKFNLSVIVRNSEGDVAFNSPSEVVDLQSNQEYKGELAIPKDFMNDGRYTIDLHLVDASRIVSMTLVKEILSFELQDKRETLWVGKWAGMVRPKFKFDITANSFSIQ